MGLNFLLWNKKKSKISFGPFALEFFRDTDTPQMQNIEWPLHWIQNTIHEIRFFHFFAFLIYVCIWMYSFFLNARNMVAFSISRPEISIFALEKIKKLKIKNQSTFLCTLSRWSRSGGLFFIRPANNTTQRKTNKKQNRNRRKRKEDSSNRKACIFWPRRATKKNGKKRSQQQPQQTTKCLNKERERQRQNEKSKRKKLYFSIYICIIYVCNIKVCYEDFFLRVALKKKPVVRTRRRRLRI